MNRLTGSLKGIVYVHRQREGKGKEKTEREREREREERDSHIFNTEIETLSKDTTLTYLNTLNT